MKNEFYVYIFLNPLKEGDYNYGKLQFNYEPFYVGKGKGRRCLDHLCKCNKNNSIKSRTISKITTNGLIPIINFYEVNLTEIQAFSVEMYLISLIGRRNLNKGPLGNLTNGGEGATGRVMTAQQKEVARINSIGNTHSLGRKHTAEELDKMRTARIGYKMTEETKKKIGQKSKGRLHKEESKIKIAKANYKPIVQYTLNMEIVREWEATIIASNELNICMSSIHKCLSGTRRKAGGFIFKYK